MMLVWGFGSQGSKLDNNDSRKKHSCDGRPAYMPFPGDDGNKNHDNQKASSRSSAVVSYSSSSTMNSATSVDLHVTNLDQSIGAKEMKNLLTTVFKQHVMVRHTSCRKFFVVVVGFRCCMFFFCFFVLFR